MSRVRLLDKGRAMVDEAFPVVTRALDQVLNGLTAAEAGLSRKAIASMDVSARAGKRGLR